MDLREPKETLIGVIVDNPSALEVGWAITPTLPLKGWMMLRNILSSARRKDNIINNVNLLVENHWHRVGIWNIWDKISRFMKPVKNI